MGKRGQRVFRWQPEKKNYKLVKSQQFVAGSRVNVFIFKIWIYIDSLNVVQKLLILTGECVWVMLTQYLATYRNLTTAR